jgi:hypothetical protein
LKAGDDIEGIAGDLPLTAERLGIIADDDLPV